MVSEYPALKRQSYHIVIVRAGYGVDRVIISFTGANWLVAGS